MMRFVNLFLLLILMLPFAASVGYSPPSQREFLFEPDRHFEVEIGVSGSSVGVDINSEHEEVLEYVHLEDPAPNTGARVVRVVFDLPGEMEPGVYHVDLYVSERPTGGGIVTATATAKLRLRLRVLSDEKILEVLSIRVPSVAEGLRANATIGVISRTTQPIYRAYADVRVYDNGSLVADGTTDAISLLSSESGTLFGTLGTEQLRGGDYDVNATVHYDGKMAETPTTVLQIGTLHVEVTGHTQRLQYNATNKFLLNLSNRWNRELQDVYAFVQMGGQQKKTPSQDIGPFGTTEYEVYFDRDDTVGPGEVPVNITVAFRDLNPRSGQYEDREERFVRLVGVVQPEKEESGFLASPVAYVLIAVALLVLLWIVFRRRANEKE